MSCDGLPGDGNRLALTIDDGTNSEVVAAFAALAADTGVRLTFFPNGCYRSWEDNAGGAAARWSTPGRWPSATTPGPTPT